MTNPIEAFGKAFRDVWEEETRRAHDDLVARLNQARFGEPLADWMQQKIDAQTHERERFVRELLATPFEQPWVSRWVSR